MLIEWRAEAQFAKAEYSPASQRRRDCDADSPIHSAALAHMQRNMIVVQLLLGEQRIVLAAAPCRAKRRLWRKDAVQKRAWQLKANPDEWRGMQAPRLPPRRHGGGDRQRHLIGRIHKRFGQM